MITRHARVKGSGNFDRLRFFNIHLLNLLNLNRSTGIEPGTFGLATGHRNPCTTAAALLGHLKVNVSAATQKVMPKMASKYHSSPVLRIIGHISLDNQYCSYAFC